MGSQYQSVVSQRLAETLEAFDLAQVAQDRLGDIARAFSAGPELRTGRIIIELEGCELHVAVDQNRRRVLLEEVVPVAAPASLAV